MIDPKNLTAENCADLIRNKEISATELTNIYLERSRKINTKINSLITISDESALMQANFIDKNIDNLKEKPLLGVPISIKDAISTQSIKTTAGSKILSTYIPPYDAEVVKKVKDSGAIIISKANCDEFAMGSSNETSYYGVCKNPWNTQMVPGGSSGGSAASVASSQNLISIGSDTGGSIRQPASLCGVTGLKPTYGSVSRAGLIAFGSSLDQIGPFAKNVSDCEILFKTIRGHDKNDLTSNINIGEYLPKKYKDFKNLKVAICSDLVNENIDENVSKNFNKSVEIFRNLGAEVKEINIPHIKESLSVYYLTAPSEASSNLNRYDGIKYGFSDNSGDSSWDTIRNTRSNFGTEVKRRILLGTFALSSGYYDDYYDKAQKIRGMITQSFESVFQNFDIIISPTSPTVAFPIGSFKNDPIRMYQNDICTMPANIAGIPALSIPSGLDNNMPIGLQIMGPNFSEPELFGISKLMESQLDWDNKRMPL